MHKIGKMFEKKIGVGCDSSKMRPVGFEPGVSIFGDDLSHFSFLSFLFAFPRPIGGDATKGAKEVFFEWFERSTTWK